MKNYFVFDGVSSLSKNIRIEHNPHIYGGAAPALDEYIVPGRDGSIFLSRKRRDNVEVSYETHLKTPSEKDIPRFAGDLKRWLLSDPGQYKRLEDTYDPDHFRKALYLGGLDIDAVLQGYTKQNIRFTCLPYRYRKSGEEFLPFKNTGGSLYIALHNVTDFTAHPIIKLHTKENFAGDIDIHVEEDTKITTYTLNASEAGEVIINSDEQKLTNSVILSLFNPYPEIPPTGTFSIRIISTVVESAYIAPLWREL